MGHYSKRLKRFVLEIMGLRYTDTEWEKVYIKGKGWSMDNDRRESHLELSANFNASVSAKTTMVDSTPVDMSYFKKTAIESYLMKNMTGLKFEHCFKDSKKRVPITLMSKLESGTLDQRILKDPAAEGFLYFLNLPKISAKPMYISIPEITQRLLSGEWIETTGAIKNLL